MIVNRFHWEATGMLVKTGPQSATNTGDQVRAHSIADRHNVIVNELLAERDRLVTALATFGQHKRGCASQWRAETGSSSQIGPCDCGLADAISGKQAVAKDSEAG